MKGSASAGNEAPVAVVSEVSPAMSRWDGRITVEHALYVAVVAVAITVRLWGLARMPLNSLEAANALKAWHVAVGTAESISLTPASPLYLHIQTLIFWLGANGDAAARVGAAIAGAMLALVPWLLRGFLGRSTALALAVLIAIDPWLVAFSRFADGAMLSTLLATALLSLLMALAREGDGPLTIESTIPQPDQGVDGRRTTTVAIAVLGGLFMTSGHMVWSYLPVLLVFVAYNYSALRQNARLDRMAFVWFGSAFLIGASGWFMRPEHIGYVSGSLTMWANQTFAMGMASDAAASIGSYPVMWPFMSLVTEQPFVTLFGLGGLVHMTWRRRTLDYSAVHWRPLLWIWLAWGAVLCLLPGRSPFSLIVIVMPLLFSAAYAIGELLQVADFGPRTRETVAVVGTLILLLVSAAFWAAALVSAPNLDMLTLQAVLLILLLSAAILVFYGIWVAWRDAAWVAMAVVGTVLLLIAVGATSRINHRFDLGRGAGLFSESGATEVRRLAVDIQTISSQRLGDPLAIGVIVDGSVSKQSGNAAQVAAAQPPRDNDPILAWYLRDMRGLHWGARSSADMDQPDQPLIVSSEDTGQGAISGADYIGSRYAVRRLQPFGGGGWVNVSAGEYGETSNADSLWSRALHAWSERVQPWLRWTLYRDSDVPFVVEDVVLWAPRPE